MKRGDKMYKVSRGPEDSAPQLEVVTFIEESVLPGASLPTVEVRSRGEKRQRIRTSPGYYLPTEKEAWLQYLANCREALPRMLVQRDELDTTIADVVATIARISKAWESDATS